MPLRAAIISMGSVSSQWTRDAMRKRFDEVDELNIREIEVRIGSDQVKVLYQGQPLHSYDCIYAKGSYKYAAVLRAITQSVPATTYMPLTPDAFAVGHDKLHTHLALQVAGVPQPRTYLAATVEAGKKLLKEVSYPIVMKLPAGTHGKGVMFADSYESASSLMDTLTMLRQPFIIQEYIDTDGVDTRAFVVGDRVVASMERRASNDEKRSNIHAGGSGKAVTLTPDEQRVAVAAAKACGCAICGVDLLITPTGPKVLEINTSPGLQGITKVTQIPVADRIAAFLHQEAKKRTDARTEQEKKTVVSDALEQKHEIITQLMVKGDRIVLPAFVRNLSKLDSGDEVVIRVDRGKILITGSPSDE